MADLAHNRLSTECMCRKNISGFLEAGLKQAEKYDPEKIPVLVLKEKNMSGELAVLRLSHFQQLFGDMVS